MPARARQRVLPKLHRPWFAGGTVNFATVQGRVHVLAPREAGFEDGTLNYLSIPAVRDRAASSSSAIGLDDDPDARRAASPVAARASCSRCATATAGHMVRIYGPATTDMRGGTITLNLYDPDGHLLDYRRVEELAGAQRISLRTGCFCNPGAGETAEG